MPIDYKNYLKPAALFTLIGSLADQYNIETYVVGGFVRDALLNKNCTDIDIVCVGNSKQLIEAVAKKTGNPKVSIFKNFNTAKITCAGYEIEFVQARKESYTRDSRKPKVQDGTFEEDIFRRDFTINTLAIGLNAHNFGQLVNLCHGLEDLKNRSIQTPLDPVRTFSDDPLRMLRAVRFAAQLGFTLTSATEKAIQQEATRLKIVSKERILSEFNKILLAASPKASLHILDKVGLLPLILPELESLKGVEVIQGLSHKENFLHTLQVVENISEAIKDQKHPKKLWLIWAGLLHDIGKPMTKGFDPKIGFTFHGHEKAGAKMASTIFRRLGLPMRAELRYVKKLVRMHLRHIPLVENEVSDTAIRRFIHDAGDELEDLLILCKADVTSSSAKKIATYKKNFNTLEKRILLVEEKDRIRQLKPVIDGQVIMSTFDLPPGKKVGILKKAIKEAILDGTISNEYAAAYAYMLKHAKTMGLLPKNSL